MSTSSVSPGSFRFPTMLISTSSNYVSVRHDTGAKLPVNTVWLTHISGSGLHVMNIVVLSINQWLPCPLVICAFGLNGKSG